MPITELQRNSGGFSGTSGSATLGAGTTAGNTLILVIGSTSSINTPSGFTRDTAAAAGTSSIWRKTAVDAETSWTITAASTRDITWDIFEVEGIDNASPVDASAGTAGAGGSSGTTTLSTTYDGIVIAALSSTVTTGGAIHTWSAHTNGFEEQSDHGQSNGTTGVGLSVAWRSLATTGTWETTGTATGGTLQGVIVAYTAVGAKRAANLSHFWAFKVGTAAAGLGVGIASSRYFETVVGAPAVTADGLQLTGAASIQNVQGVLVSTASQTIKSATSQVRFRLDSVSGDLELAGTLFSSINVILRYVSASQKLGVKIGTGSEVLSDATVTTGVWYTVDICHIGTTVNHTADWQIDYGAGPVAQTQATFTSAGALGSWWPELGWQANATGTVTYAHAMYSIVAAHYPLGEFTFALLKAAGPLTISGTSSNFALMTANATGAAWDAAAALANITEGPPPTIGAGAAGFCQTAVATSDYVEIPMEDYNPAGTGSVRAVRMVACGWAASATAATIGFRAHDGVAETTLLSVQDPEFDNSTSAPAWVCKMYRPTGGWTQTKLDALAFRVGFSGDPTPDIGIHAIYAEVAIQLAATEMVIGEVGGVEATEARDPLSGGMLGITVATPADQGATLNWDDAGVPGSQAIGPGASHTETFDGGLVSTDYVEVVSDADAPERG
jgi:hypothetical protein